MPLQYLENALLLVPFRGIHGQSNDFEQFGRMLRSSGSVAALTNLYSKFHGVSMHPGVPSNTFLMGVTSLSPGTNKLKLNPGDYPEYMGSDRTLNQFTLRMWVYTTTAFASAKGFSVFTGQPYMSTGTDASGNFRIYTNLGYTTTAVPFTSDEWHFIEMSYSNGNLKVYLDGAEVIDVSSVSAIPASASLYLGGDPQASGTYSTSYFNDVEVLNTLVNTAPYTPPDETYMGLIQGLVYDENGVLAQRTIRATPRVNRNYVIETTSDPVTGRYELWLPQIEHDVYVLDESGTKNDQIKRIFPLPVFWNITPSGTWESNSLSERLGYQFTVQGEDLSINSLGVFGASTTIENVRIHRVFDGQLMAEANITPVVDSWVDASITPVTLALGQQYTISYRAGGSSRNTYRNPTSEVISQRVTLQDNVFSSDDNLPTSTSGNQYYNVRFGYQPTA